MMRCVPPLGSEAGPTPALPPTETEEPLDPAPATSDVCAELELQPQSAAAIASDAAESKRIERYINGGPG